MVNEQRQAVMQSCCDSAALERLGALRVAKPEKATEVENIVIANLSRGQIQGKVNESQMIDLMRSISEKQAEETKDAVEFKRRGLGGDDSDDVDWDNLDL